MKFAPKYARLRTEYRTPALRFVNAPENPFDLFAQWFEEALAMDLPDVNAMALATTDEYGVPSVRIVLMKDFNKEEETVIFFTNYESSKAKEIEGNGGKVSLCFWWPPFARQVRMWGVASRLSDEANQTYFSMRPKEAQIAAWASKQSKPMETEEALKQRFLYYSHRFQDIDPIPCPPFWGGYAIKVHRMEFWQGREHRLHDRLLYVKGTKYWTKQKLYP